MLLAAPLLAFATKDSFFTCQPVNKSAIDSFCEQLLPSLPTATCVDATGYQKRSERDYEKQRGECATEHRRRQTCPNAASGCTAQVFSYEGDFLSETVYGTVHAITP